MEYVFFNACAQELFHFLWVYTIVYVIISRTVNMWHDCDMCTCKFQYQFFFNILLKWRQHHICILYMCVNYSLVSKMNIIIHLNAQCNIVVGCMRIILDICVRLHMRITYSSNDVYGATYIYVPTTYMQAHLSIYEYSLMD